jgi:hypothetical protein
VDGQVSDTKVGRLKFGLQVVENSFHRVVDLVFAATDHLKAILVEVIAHFKYFLVVLDLSVGGFFVVQIYS